MSGSKGVRALRASRIRERDPVALVPVYDPPVIPRHAIVECSPREWLRVGLYADELAVLIRALQAVGPPVDPADWSADASRDTRFFDEGLSKLLFAAGLQRELQPCRSGEDRG